MVTVLTIIVVAFMTSMSIERKTSQSYANIERARLAAEAALSEITQRIVENTKSDDFTVARTISQLGDDDFPVFYIGVPDMNSIRYFPLFSGGVTQPLSGELAVDDKIPSGSSFSPEISASTARQTTSLRIPAHITNGGENPVRVGWIELPDENGKVVARYAYWAEDLGGYLDAELAGAKPLTRTTGGSPEELGIFTLFRPTEKVDIVPDGSTLDAKLINERSTGTPDEPKSILFSNSTLGQLSLGDGITPGGYVEEEDFQRFFAVNLRYPPEPDTVPRGFGYSDAGKVKKNLNQLIDQGGQAAVEEIADYIRINLPDFDARKGSFPPSQDYLKTLAANIIDYADDDNEATVGVDYRGVDSYPFTTQFYTQISWVNHEGGNDEPWFASGGTWRSKAKVQYHIQVWNPSNKAVDTGRLSLDMAPLEGMPNTTGEQFAFYYSGSEVLPFFPFPEGTPAQEYVFAAGNALQPNEFRAISFPEIEYEIDSDISSSFPRPAKSGGGRPKFSLKNASDSVNESSYSYRLRWNGQVVDQPGAVTRGSDRIFERNSGNMDRAPATAGEGPAWRGGQPGLRHGSAAGIFATSQSYPLLGDPRGTFYVSDYIAASDYAQNASWWGRHFISDESTSGVRNWFVREARFRAWPDGGHDDPQDRGFALGSVTPTGDNAAARRAKRNLRPIDIPASSRPPIQPLKAPSRISNRGTLDSITELGHIYDPIQWRPAWQSPETDNSVEEKWRELGQHSGDPAEDVGNMIADPNYVVPTTLRVGRGEFAIFDEYGKQASQLFDLFKVNEERTVAGRININTASREVLRTLGAGIIIESDPRVLPEGLRTGNQFAGPSDVRQADLLADAIIENRPFVSTSQLANIKVRRDDKEVPFFGNPELWNPDERPTRWLDTAAEEYFRKLWDLTSVRSRNFRVYIVGETLADSGAPIARAHRVVEFSVEPVRENDAIQSQEINVIHEKDL